MKIGKAAATTLLVAITVLAAGCGGSDDGGSAATGATETQEARASNGTDAAFAASMLPHHEGGVELGQIAAEKGTDPEIRMLGEGIVAEQQEQAATLEQMTARFAMQPDVPEPIMERGMMDMEALEQASGEEFDRLWLDIITAHHIGAVQMAGLEVEGGQDPEAVELAEAIIESQLMEITTFNRLKTAMG